MKSFFGKLSIRFPFLANRPSALERAVRQSPKSRRLQMEPLENRALLAVDAFGGAASLAESNVEESWGPDPAPAAFSASVLATDAAIVDVSGVDATSAVASFSVQSETPEPVAPPSFEQLMEALGQVEIESLDDENVVASASYLDNATSATQSLETQAEARQVVFYDSSAADFDASTLNLDDESVYYVDGANANDDGAESYSATPRSGGNSSDSGGSGGSSNSGGTSSSGGSNAGTSNGGYLTTYGSSSIPESATFTGSGGSDQGPYFGFTTPAIPNGCWAYVRFEGGDAVYGEDYVVRCATVDEDGVVTPNMNYVSGGAAPNNAYDIYVYGPATYCVVPLNDFDPETHEDVVATLYFDMLSGGSDVDPPPVAYDSFTATIIDDDPSNLSVYWRNGSDPTTGATLSGNPNGGGFRVFPEKVDSEAKVARNQVDLVFRLSAISVTDTVIRYKVLDPDNYISLGKDQTTDSNCAGDDNNWSFSLEDEITIPAGKLEAVKSVVISTAYAGDNFIVVADKKSNADAVDAAKLGTTTETRYRLVQPTTNQPAYSPMLTVWRTLWAERDHMTSSVAPSIDGLVASELARACVEIKNYPDNPRALVADLENVGISDNASNLGLLPRDLSAPTDNFWTLHLVGILNLYGYNKKTEKWQPAYGVHYNNTVLSANSLLESDCAQYNQTNPDNQVNVTDFKRRTTLHEIGHAFTLNHASSGVMKTELSVGEAMAATNLKFLATDIQTIQSQRKPL